MIEMNLMEISNELTGYIKNALEISPYLKTVHTDIIGKF